MKTIGRVGGRVHGTGARAVAALGLLLTVLAAGGCAFQVEAEPVIAADVVDANPRERISGRYAVLINADALDARLKSTGILCAVASYSVKLRDAYVETAEGALGQWVEETETVDEANVGGFDGQISMLVTGIRSRVAETPTRQGILIDTRAEVVIRSLIVIREGDRIVSRDQIETRGGVIRPTGLGCHMVRNVMEAAAAEALKTLVEDIGKALEPLRGAKTMES